MRTADPTSLLPLKPVDFLILLMLARGESHGYRVMQDVAEHTRGGIRLEAGSMYRTIRRLQDDDLIQESARRPPDATDDERRRYYRLTPFGKRVAAAEAARLRELVRIAESTKLLSPVPAV